MHLIIVAYSEKQNGRSDVTENGLADYAAVDAVGKLATTWALVEMKI